MFLSYELYIFATLVMDKVSSKNTLHTNDLGYVKQKYLTFAICPGCYNISHYDMSIIIKYQLRFDFFTKFLYSVKKSYQHFINMSYQHLWITHTIISL